MKQLLIVLIGVFDFRTKLDLNMWHLVRFYSKEFNTVFGSEKYSSQKLKNREIVFFIQPNEQISVSATLGEFGMNYKISGNEISDQRNEFKQKVYPLEERYNRLAIHRDKAEVQKDEQRTKELTEQLKSISDQISRIELVTIVQHPDWIYSAEVLANFPTGAISNHYENLTPNIQNSFFGIHLSKILNAAEIGSPAPAFTLQNDRGEEISLNDFTGKYLVLYFWGAWCGYCLKGIPKMKEYYSKYKEPIEFISIDCKDNKQAWRKAIAKYDLNWVNLFAENERITDKYGVEGYPTKIIIDKEGKIVLKTTGESDEFYVKTDELFNK
jgi:peroxiredoxin